MDYYLGLGYGNTYSVGKFSHKPSLPLTDVDLISDLEFTLSDDPMDYEQLVVDEVAKLGDKDSLTIAYPNKAALYILDEWAEDFNIPNNQREELWSKDGVEETFIYFINEEEENWIWLADAQVDYYDEDDRPVPIYPADEEDDE
jgi:hypothetical protein